MTDYGNSRQRYLGVKNCVFFNTTALICAIYLIIFKFIQIDPFLKHIGQGSKNCSLRLPYLRKGSLNHFQIDLILCFRAQNYAHKSQIY